MRSVSPKKQYGTGVAHPAPFSSLVLPELARMLSESHRLVLDPFAGVGRVHELVHHFEWPTVTIGVEIEPEWASLHKRTGAANALALPFRDGSFDAVVTSPTYGNRLADHHNARDGSLRRSYTHDLGRRLHEDNSGAMHWGKQYRAFHLQAWSETRRVLRENGRLVVNVSDHIRKGERQHVVSWHIGTLLKMGFVLVDAATIATPRLRQGANRDQRVNSEFVLAFDKTI